MKLRSLQPLKRLRLLTAKVRIARIKEKLMGFPSDELYYDCFFHHYHFFLFGLHPKQQDIYFFLVRGSFLGFYLRTC